MSDRPPFSEMNVARGFATTLPLTYEGAIKDTHISSSHGDIHLTQSVTSDGAHATFTTGFTAAEAFELAGALKRAAHAAENAIEAKERRAA